MELEEEVVLVEAEAFFDSDFSVVEFEATTVELEPVFIVLVSLD